MFIGGQNFPHHVNTVVIGVGDSQRLGRHKHSEHGRLLLTDHKHYVLLEVRVEITGIDRVVDVALLDNRIARHSGFHFLSFDFLSQLPFANRIDSVIVRFKILNESIVEVRSRIRPENIPIVFKTGLQHKYPVVDRVQKFVVLI